MPSGAKPGERRGGRKAGVPNKVTRDLKEIAQLYTEEAILTAAAIMRAAKKPAAARLTAVSIILDRGHGKPPQALHHGGPDGGPITLEALIMARIKKKEPPGQA
jgi:hypothetical protein